MVIKRTDVFSKICLGAGDCTPLSLTVVAEIASRSFAAGLLRVDVQLELCLLFARATGMLNVQQRMQSNPLSAELSQHRAGILPGLTAYNLYFSSHSEAVSKLSCSLQSLPLGYQIPIVPNLFWQSQRFLGERSS